MPCGSQLCTEVTLNVTSANGTFTEPSQSQYEELSYLFSVQSVHRLQSLK